MPGTSGVRRGGRPPRTRSQEVTQMPDTRFLVEVVLGVPVVTTPEEIDITNADGLRAALLEAAAHGSGTLVVDMTRTLFCDSAGLHALVAAHKRALAEGGEVVLALAGAAVLRIFSITGLDRVIACFTTLDEALAHATASATTDAGTASLREAAPPSLA
jgi:anti-sigma B factor antagonist